MALSFGTSSSSSSSKSYLPVQADALTQAINRYIGTLGKNETFQGETVAPFTDLQNQAVGSANNFLNLFGTPQSYDTPLSDETGSTLKGLLSGQSGASAITPEQAQQYYKASIYDPTMQSLQQDILPAVDEGFAGGNFFGSGRAKSREKAIADTGRYLTQEKANLDWNVLQQNQSLAESKANRAAGAVGSAMQYGQQPAQTAMNNLSIAASQIGGLNSLFGIGQESQTQAQKELQAEIEKFAQDQQITDPTNLAILLSLIGQSMSSSKSSGSSTSFGL